VIEIKDLKKIYSNGVSTIALNGVSFNISEGEFVAIKGPSGSGKSTLLHILGFLDRPTSGTYKFKGRNIDEFSDEKLAKIRNEEIGFVFQAFNLLPRSTALENVMLPLIYANFPQREQIKKAKKALEEVGLVSRMNHFPNQLSGGEQQRVAIARAIVNSPSLILADEPTGNLDSKSSEKIIEIFKKLNEKGHTIVIVTHEEYVVEAAKRIIYLKDGRVIKEERKI